MSKIIHISQNKRSLGNSGGVEKFATYLDQALGVTIYSSDDYKAGCRPEELNKHLISKGMVTKDDLVVTDGYWNLGLPDEIRTIPVCHGTYAANYLKESCNVFNELIIGFRKSVKDQRKAFSKINSTPVSVSESARRELRKFYDIDSKVILNGVDCDLYRPSEKDLTHKPIILHAATNAKKGKHLMGGLQELLPDFQIEFLEAKIGEEPDKFKRGDMFLHLATNEGNSYACLEAMSTGLPCLLTNVGLFEDFPIDNHFVKLIDYKKRDNIAFVANEIKSFWKKRLNYYPRKWIMENASLEIFKKNWQNFIKQVQNS